jgi:antitoxin component YwqK of YwqJK toxin-antitoxin module
MRIFTLSMLFVLVFLLMPGCHSQQTPKKETLAESDTLTVPDTGYTGIKQYLSGKYLVKEVTFKNGVRQGLMKTFYVTGEVRQTFIYSNGLREDSSYWYFQEGQKFRVTPYKKDTIDGIQRQYFRTGQLRAKIGFSKGLRTSFFQEYTKEGKLVSGYPSITVNVTDNYKANGSYKVKLGLSDKSTNVTFWQGEFNNGRFDTAHYVKINAINGIGNLNLKKSGTARPQYVGVIAEILTNYGNNYLLYKKIDLPYNDLK